MREWLHNEDEDEKHMLYIGSNEKKEELLEELSAAEEWLLDGEGEHASYVEYVEKHSDINGKFEKLKQRKAEH